MFSESIRVRVSTPSEPIRPGRGFYQLEEDALYVQIGSFDRGRKFFSYLETEQLLLSLDRHGRLIFIEVSLPRRHWKVDQQLTWPTNPRPADIRFPDFRCRIPSPALIGNFNRTVLSIRFGDEEKSEYYYLSETVLLQISNSNHLSAIWISEIEDDLAGRELATFRKHLQESSIP